MGGDPVVGSNFLDLVERFYKDPDTEAVVLFSEPGGVIEEKLAEWVQAEQVSMPIVTFIAGRFVDEMPGMRFGHAATIVEGEKGSTKSKIKVLERAGVKVAHAFSDIVTILRREYEV